MRTDLVERLTVRKHEIRAHALVGISSNCLGVCIKST